MAIDDSKYGAVNGVKGLYTVPNGSGTQFSDACDSIWDAGLRTVKIYCTADYVTDYPYQTSWSSSPTNLTQLCQTTQFSTQLARSWDTVMMTVFTFANGTTNWWRPSPTGTKLSAEYTEIYNLVTHLLTTYNNTGKTFILQNWEGDWAFGDSFDPATPIARKYVDYYAAFLGIRQKAVEDARRDTAYSNVKVLHAIELNRVLDAQTYPNRRRILTQIAPRVQPDIISYSAYDSTIADIGYGSSFSDWTDKCTEFFGHALRMIKKHFPNSIVSIGEFGFPENEMLISNGGVGYDPELMLEVVRDVAEAAGVSWLIFWQVFDNETSALPQGVRGYWMVKPNGDVTPSGARMADFAAGL